MSKRVCISLLLFCLGSITTPSFVFADQDADRAATFNKRLTETQQRLGLTDGQVEKMTPILKAQIKTMAATLKRYGIDPESGQKPDKKLSRQDSQSLGKELKLVRADTHQQLESILNKEQLEGFKQFQQERKKEKREQMRSQRSQGVVDT
jgi:hypothetical protein